jgi:hypothetical protein
MFREVRDENATMLIVPPKWGRVLKRCPGFPFPIDVRGSHSLISNFSREGRVHLCGWMDVRHPWKKWMYLTERHSIISPIFPELPSMSLLREGTTKLWEQIFGQPFTAKFER